MKDYWRTMYALIVIQMKYYEFTKYFSSFFYISDIAKVGAKTTKPFLTKELKVQSFLRFYG